MKGNLFKSLWFKLLMISSAAIWLPRCGSGQKLIGIAVTPATVVFGGVDPTLFAQLTAVGTYSHPPATKDITAQVTWTSNIPQVAVVNSSGRVTPNVACGVAGITATLKTNHPTDNIISGTMSVTVDGPTVGCPHTPP